MHRFLLFCVVSGFANLCIGTAAQGIDFFARVVTTCGMGIIIRLGRRLSKSDRLLGRRGPHQQQPQARMLGLEGLGV